MIPRENLYKESLLKFKGVYCRWIDVFSHINSIFPLTLQQDLELQSCLKTIGEENIIFPLELNRIEVFQDDKPGCRIYDWKLLSTPQIKTAMRISGRYKTVQVAHVPMTSFCAQVIDGKTIPDALPFEKYDKFLNVTYLVNDEFLQDWCNPNYENKNVAKKIVKDCSVSELLFAIKKKIDKRG